MRAASMRRSASSSAARAAAAAARFSSIWWSLRAHGILCDIRVTLRDSAHSACALSSCTIMRYARAAGMHV